MTAPRPAAARLLRDSRVGEFLFGLHPVAAALEGTHRVCHRLVIQQRRSTGGPASELLPLVRTLAAERRVEVTTASREAMNLASGGRPHNGVLLDVSPAAYSSELRLDSTLPCREGEAPIVVSLDELTDPQNVGAVLRSCLFFGVAGVIVSSKNSAPLSPTVSKASSGSLESLLSDRHLHCTKNLPRTLEAHRAAGWRVLGATVPSADSSERALDSSEIGAGTDGRRPTILVLGSEGKGLRTNVARACDACVVVSSAGAAERWRTHQRAGLNVSTAAAVLLHSLQLGRGRWDG